VSNKALLEEIGPLPTIHSRESVVHGAERDFYDFESEVIGKVGTPYVHSISALAAVLNPEEWRNPKLMEEATKFVKAWREKHGLTDGEVTKIIASRLASDAMYLIRSERHGDSDKPGGIE
jgi:hypothetical protein